MKLSRSGYGQAALYIYIYIYQSRSIMRRAKVTDYDLKNMKFDWQQKTKLGIWKKTTTPADLICRRTIWHHDNMQTEKYEKAKQSVA